MAHRRRFPYLPPRIEGLASLAMNISWSWSRSARSLFASIDEPLWHFTRHNPIMVLRRVHPERLSAVARDPQFLALYDRLMRKTDRERTSQGTWVGNHYPELVDRPPDLGIHHVVERLAHLGFADHADLRTLWWAPAGTNVVGTVPTVRTCFPSMVRAARALDETAG